MPEKPISNPLVSPTLMTGVGFGFHEEFVVVSIQYPADLEQVAGTKNEAHFLVQADQMEALGARFIEVGQMALQVLKPRGSA